MNEITGEVKVGQVWKDIKSANTRYVQIIEVCKDDGVAYEVVYRAFARPHWKFSDGDATKKRKYPQGMRTSIKNLLLTYRRLNDAEIAELEKPVASTAVSSVASEKSNNSVPTQKEDTEEKTATQTEKKATQKEENEKAVLAQISDDLAMLKQTVHVLQLLLQNDNETLRKEIEALRGGNWRT